MLIWKTASVKRTDIHVLSYDKLHTNVCDICQGKIQYMYCMYKTESSTLGNNLLFIYSLCIKRNGHLQQPTP
jgi:hypothetical protein